LREYLATGSDAQDPAALGVSPGASMYEAVRDGLVPSIEEKKGQLSFPFDLSSRVELELIAVSPH